MSTIGTALAPGVVVAETYEVERLLGRGGMGEVWAAKHRRLPGKQVAIKVLHTNAGPLPAEALARFRREAEIAARLSHPNIVEVLDFNTLPSGQPFLVMALLRGNSLADRLSQGPMGPDEVKNIVKQVGSALHAAHALGVVHRDLKPENIFLEPTELGDQAKVLDFGISKLADSNSVQTTDSVLIGTPLYMSPEQARGENREITAQSDVFSLASICYEMLAGTPAFLADGVAKVVFRIAYEPFKPLDTVRPGLPPALVQGIERALVKDKAQRTPDVATFVREVTGEGFTSRSASELPRVGPATGGGVYRSGMGEVSASMAEGATRMPSAAQMQPVVSSRATPGVAVAPAVVDSAARTVPTPQGGLKRWWPIGVGLVIAVAAMVGRALMPPTRVELPVVVVDAGAVVVPAAVPDSGPGQVVAPTLPEAAPDAGPGKVVVPLKPYKEEPIPADDRIVLAEVEAYVAKGKWDAVVDTRLGYEGRLHSAAGKQRLMMLVIEGACHERLNSAGAFLNRLEVLYGNGAKKEALRRCRKSWPEREFE